MSSSEKPEGAKIARLFPEPAGARSGGGSSLVTANIDGGARGNPGPAAYGIVLKKADGSTLVAAGKYVGRATNNVAEYYGLIAALDAAAQHGVRRLRVESDSELMVRQMRGEYRVKSPDLRPLHERAERLARGFEHFEITHVPREKNREADRLVNAALDGEKIEAASGGRNSNPRAADEARSEAAAGRNVRARYVGGVFRPEGTINLPDGAEVELTIRPLARRSE
jgi:probable phosphoglycerate mutase